MNKIKTKLWAAFMAALLLFCMPFTTAFALLGENGGGGVDAGSVLAVTPFGKISTLDQFAWRVNLYVSANPDGKINKDYDKIGTPQLPLVGSILCTSPNFDFTDGSKTYLQTNYTDTTRDRFDLAGAQTVTNTNGDIIGQRYTLPTLRNLNTSEGKYTDANGNTVVIASSGSISLFDNQYNTDLNFQIVNDKLTKNGRVYIM